jgi:hypothetical protein
LATLRSRFRCLSSMPLALFARQPSLRPFSEAGINQGRQRGVMNDIVFQHSYDILKILNESYGFSTYDRKRNARRSELCRAFGEQS